jgi:hypothetical protein
MVLVCYSIGAVTVVGHPHTLSTVSFRLILFFHWAVQTKYPAVRWPQLHEITAFLLYCCNPVWNVFKVLIRTIGLVLICNSKVYYREWEIPLTESLSRTSNSDVSELSLLWNRTLCRDSDWTHVLVGQNISLAVRSRIFNIIIKQSECKLLPVHDIKSYWKVEV